MPINQPTLGGPNNYGSSGYSKQTGYRTHGGYDDQGLMASQIGGQAQFIDSTTGPGANENADGKWGKWFGQPAYNYFERDEYSSLGHENYREM